MRQSEFMFDHTATNRAHTLVSMLSTSLFIIVVSVITGSLWWAVRDETGTQ